MSEQQLAEIEARLRAASRTWFEPDYQKPLLITNLTEDLELITHAPADIMALIAEVKRLRAENQSLRADRSSNGAGDDMLLDLMGLDDDEQ